MRNLFLVLIVFFLFIACGNGSSEQVEEYKIICHSNNMFEIIENFPLLPGEIISINMLEVIGHLPLLPEEIKSIRKECNEKEIE